MTFALDLDHSNIFLWRPNFALFAFSNCAILTSSLKRTIHNVNYRRSQHFTLTLLHKYVVMFCSFVRHRVWSSNFRAFLRFSMTFKCIWDAQFLTFFEARGLVWEDNLRFKTDADFFKKKNPLLWIGHWKNLYYIFMEWCWCIVLWTPVLWPFQGFTTSWPLRDFACQKGKI